MTDDSMQASAQRWWLWGCSGQATAQDRRNLRRINYVLFAWIAIFIASLIVMEGPGDGSLAVSGAALAAVTLAFIPVIFAYRRFLAEADELTRLIQVRAMAAGFGAGVFTAFTQGFVERVDSLLPSISALNIELHDLFSPLTVMVATYTVTILLEQRRYWR